MVADKSLELSITLGEKGQGGPVERHGDIETGLLIDEGENIFGSRSKPRLEDI